MGIYELSKKKFILFKMLRDFFFGGVEKYDFSLYILLVDFLNLYIYLFISV
jgi:hypothetical protein